MDKKTNDVVLTCGIARDLLPLYLDGLTSPESAAALEAHLASGPSGPPWRRPSPGRRNPRRPAPPGTGPGQTGRRLRPRWRKRCSSGPPAGGGAKLWRSWWS